MVPCFSGLPRRSYRVFGAGILAALSLTLAACGGTDTPSTTPTEPPAAWALQPVSDAVLVERLRTALNPGNSAKSVAESAVLVSVPSSDALGGAAAAAAVSGTVLQEAAVDEADWIKSDGQSVFSVWPGSASAAG